MLLADQPSQGAGFALEELAEFEEDAGAGQRRGRRPGREGRGRRLDRAVDLGATGEGDTARPLTGRRVVDVAPAPACSVDALAVDGMLAVAHGDEPAWWMSDQS